MKVDIGVIGVGYLGGIHARILKRIPSANFVGIYDIDDEKAEKISKELKVKKFSSLDEILSSVSAVVIATPTTTHYEIAMRALERGVHAFIEKPITVELKQADEIAKVSRERNLKVQVGYVERFNPAVLSLRGYEIRPVFIEVHRLAQFKPRGVDVAVILDLMIHDIDLILNFVRSDIVEIRASGVAVISDSIDIANARLQFENGCVANVTASRISRKNERKMRIFQKDTYIALDFLNGEVEVFRLVDSSESYGKLAKMLGMIELASQKRKIIYEKPKVKEVNQIECELKEFLDAIIYGREVPVTAEDAMRSLEVAYRIIAEIEKQQEIVLKKMSQIENKTLNQG